MVASQQGGSYAGWGFEKLIQCEMAISISISIIIPKRQAIIAEEMSRERKKERGRRKRSDSPN